MATYISVRLSATTGGLYCLDSSGEATELYCLGEAGGKLELGGDSFTASRIKSCNISLVVSPAGEVLEYDTLEAELDFGTKFDPKNYDYGTIVYYYHDSDLIGKFYLTSISRTGRTFYTIECVSAVGLLANPKHYGGLYTGELMPDVLSDIIGGYFPYTLDATFSDVAVYGWLPVATRRENLHQLLFAMGAAVKKDSIGDPYITTIDSEIVNAISDSRIYSGGSVTYSNSQVIAQVYEHLYEKFDADSEVTLYSGEIADSSIVTPKGEVVSGSIIVFDNPCHDLTAEGTTVLESGVNYAVLSPTGECTLTGKEYSHTARLVTRPDYDSTDTDDKDEVTVEDATLVSAFNSENVAARLLSYYSSARTVSGSIVVGTERPGDAVSMLDVYDEEAEGLLTSLDITASSILKGDFSLVADYTPSGAGNFYNNEVIITEDGTWTVPSGVTRIRAILIGGGSSGAAGTSGENGDNYLTEDDTRNGGAGGSGGEGGSGGNVLIVTMSVTEGSTLTAIVGWGGGAGEETTAVISGDATTFAGYSSADGAATTNGYTDLLTGEIYAAPGADGIDGGEGGGQQRTDVTGDDRLNGADVTGPDGTLYYGGRSTEVDGSFPGGGGGAAVGADGAAGTSTSSRGNGGDGASATIAGVAGASYGSGGGGGHGGGGGGTGNRGNSGSGRGSGGDGGSGSNGGSGANGCVIIYY